jgi:hypothetical protein
METQIRQQAEPRIFFDQPVAIYVADRERPLHGRALNLSRGGIFVRVETLLPRTTPVAILFELPDGQLVDAEATVVRLVRPESATEPTGMALCFGPLDPAAEERIEQFIIGRTRPAGGEEVRLHLDRLGYPIKARTHSAWQNMLSVDAELPFLQLGSPVSVPLPEGSNGSIRWVSVHVPPDSGIPRINIGIEIDAQPALGDDDDLEDRESTTSRTWRTPILSTRRSSPLIPSSWTTSSVAGVQTLGSTPEGGKNPLVGLRPPWIRTLQP